MDRRYDRLVDEALEALQDPDILIYEALLQYRLDQAHIGFAQNEEPTTPETLAASRAVHDQICADTQAEFEQFFKDLPGMPPDEQRAVRQRFLDSMGGALYVTEQDAWKAEFIKKHAGRRNPSQGGEEDRENRDGSEGAESTTHLYHRHDQIDMRLPTMREATTADRIFAHKQILADERAAKDLQARDAETIREELRLETELITEAITGAEEERDIDTYLEKTHPPISEAMLEKFGKRPPGSSEARRES